MISFSICELSRQTRRVKAAASDRPVFITEREPTTHVLLTIETYSRLGNTEPTIGDLLSMPEGAHIEFYLPRMGDGPPRDADFFLSNAAGIGGIL